MSIASAKIIMNTSFWSVFDNKLSYVLQNYFYTLQVPMTQKILKIYYKIIAILAKKFINKQRPIVVWIAGSVGKTSSRMIISQTLERFLWEKFKIYTSDENFNGEFWFSLSVFQIKNYNPSVLCFLKILIIAFYKANFTNKKYYDCIVLEYGTDFPGEMKTMLDIVKPDIWVFTKVDFVHSEQFGNPQNIANEDFKMIRETQNTAFLNLDDLYCRQAREKLKIDKFFYSTNGNFEPNKSQIWYDHIETKANRQKIIETSFAARNHEQITQIKHNLLGKEICGYISLALAITEIVGNWLNNTKNESDIFDGFDWNLSYEMMAGRSSLFHWCNWHIILDASYNSAPSSLVKTLENSYNLKKNLFKDHDILLVMWDMRELGSFAESEHRKIASFVSAMADLVYTVGPSTKQRTTDELIKIWYESNKIENFDNAVEMWKYLYNKMFDRNQKYIIVVKWGQNTIFLEEWIKHILDSEKYGKNYNKILCRQSGRRLKKKRKFFGKIE